MADAITPRGPKPRPRFSRTNIMLYGTLIVVALYYALPLYVMIVTSLKGMPEIRLGNIFRPLSRSRTNHGSRHGQKPARASTARG